MNIINAVALKSFDFDGQKKNIASNPFPVPRHQFGELKALGLVTECLAPENPSVPVGILSSVSPAGQVSPGTTAKRSGSGNRAKQG